MNQGKSLVELAQELTRRATAKTDLIVDTRRITIEPEHAHLSLEGHDDPYPLTKNAHRQLGEWSDIPVKYYKKMLADSPALLAGNVNHWLHHTDKPVERILLRLQSKFMARRAGGAVGATEPLSLISNYRLHCRKQLRARHHAGRNSRERENGIQNG